MSSSLVCIKTKINLKKTKQTPDWHLVVIWRSLSLLLDISRQWKETGLVPHIPENPCALPQNSFIVIRSHFRERYPPYGDICLTWQFSNACPSLEASSFLYCSESHLGAPPGTHLQTAPCSQHPQRTNAAEAVLSTPCSQAQACMTMAEVQRC